MDYQPFADVFTTEELNTLTNWLIVTLVGSIICGVGLMFTVGAYIHSRKSVPWSILQKVGFVALILLTGGLVFGATQVFHAGSVNSENLAKNYDVATKNLKTKYELNDVFWDDPDTEVKTATTADLQTLVVADSKSQLIVFKYKADPQTGEPFLSNMPIQGGAPPIEGVTAESLLRK